jgi:hypothetical protein
VAFEAKEVLEKKIKDLKMKLTDFTAADFEYHGERELGNTIICRELIPR